MMMKKKNLFALSLKDFFTPYFLTLSLLPLLITIAILTAIFTYSMNSLTQSIDKIKVEKVSTQYSTATYQNRQESINISFENNKSESSSIYKNPIAMFDSIKNSQIFAQLLQNKTLRWIIEKSIYLLGGYFILIISIIITITLIGFFTPLVVKKIKSRHYPPFQIKGHGTILEIIWHTLKSFIVMFILYIILIPLYFIPILNIIAFNIPSYYFFHKMLIYDIGSTINTKKEYVQIKALNATQLRIRTFFMYLLTLLPLMGIFLPILFIIYLTHIFINETVELRAVIDE